jgi:predicted nucleotidyltransferase
MKPSEALEIHRLSIRRLTHSRRAANPRVFGSAARGDDVVTIRELPPEIRDQVLAEAQPI